MECDRCRFEGCTLPGLGLDTDAERPCGEGDTSHSHACVCCGKVHLCAWPSSDCRWCHLGEFRCPACPNCPCQHRHTGPTLHDGSARCFDCGARVQPRLWAVPGMGAWLSPHHPGSGL